MKTCTTCKQTKGLMDFPFKNKARQKYHAICKLCKSSIDKIKYSTNTHDRKTKIQNRALNNKEWVKNFVYRYKQFCKCVKCGDKRHYVLDFHHLRDKHLSIADLLRRGASIEAIKKEIRKCEVLCSNCHREYHYLNNYDL